VDRDREAPADLRPQRRKAGPQIGPNAGAHHLGATRCRGPGLRPLRHRRDGL